MTTNVKLFRDIQKARTNSNEWIQQLQLGEALKDLLVLPFYVIGWILGKLWYLILFLFQIFRESFKQGSGRS